MKMIINKKVKDYTFLASVWPLDFDRTTIIFIHGASFNKESWGDQVEGLGDHFNCIAIDLPGHGESPGAGIDSIDGFADFLEAFAHEFKIKEPVLCGLSMGGAIVLNLLLRDSFPVKAGVLLNTSARLAVSDMIFNAVKKRYDAYVNMLVTFGTSERSDREALTPVIKEFSTCSKEVACDDFIACNGFDVTDELSRIEEKVLIIGGDEDKITPPSLSRKLHDGIKDSTLVIMDACGHFSNVEHPTETNSHIISFVQSL